MPSPFSPEAYQEMVNSLPEDVSTPPSSDSPPPPEDAGAEGEAEAPPSEEAPPPPPPTPLTLTDDTLVTDADGTIRPWKEIKAERLMRADYSRKTEEISDERKRFNAWAQQQQSAMQELQTKLEEYEFARSMQELGAFPDDDPYKPVITKLLTEINRLKATIPQATQRFEEATREQKAESGRQALQREEARLMTTYASEGLTQRELDIAQRNWLNELSKGNKITMEDSVRDYLNYIKDREVKAVERFKAEAKKSRPAPKVGAAGGGAQPPMGAPQEKVTLKGGGVLRQVREILSRGSAS